MVGGARRCGRVREPAPSPAAPGDTFVRRRLRSTDADDADVGAQVPAGHARDNAASCLVGWPYLSFSFSLFFVFTFFYRSRTTVAR